MQNEKKTKSEKRTKATIQLDKLVMCCKSAIEDNFNDAIKHYPEESLQAKHSFGKTTLTQTIDYSKRYKYSYNVHHCGHHIGRLDFCMFGLQSKDEYMWVTLNNATFYNSTLQFLPQIFIDLNITLNNITQLDVALDSYYFNQELTLRRAIKNKSNSIKLMGRYKDRSARLPNIKFWHNGCPDNILEVRSVYIHNQRQVKYQQGHQNIEQNNSNKTSNAKTTFGLIAYDKLDEINEVSKHKTYILDYHKKFNPNFKNIFRQEIRLTSEELYRYVKSHRKPITLSDLLNKEFLYCVFCEYYDRIIVIRNDKKQKVSLFPTPNLESLEGILPLPLPENMIKPQQTENEIDNGEKIDTKRNKIFNKINNEKGNNKQEIYINDKSINNTNEHNIIDTMKLKNHRTAEHEQIISDTLKEVNMPNHKKRIATTKRAKIGDAVTEY